MASALTPFTRWKSIVCCVNTLSNLSISISTPVSLSSFFRSSLFPTITHGRTHRGTSPIGIDKAMYWKKTCKRKSFRGGRIIQCGLLPVNLWPPTIDSQLFALSLFPYLGFLYFLTKVKSAPKLSLFGFYFLLVFVAATIPAGIHENVNYGTSLSNVDWLHGGAESLLALSNLFVVLGLRRALRKSGD